MSTGKIYTPVVIYIKKMERQIISESVITILVAYSNTPAYHLSLQNYFPLSAQPLPHNRDKHAIYANNELDLAEIDVYGFDYDYTLACYADSLHPLIYNLGRQALIEHAKVK